MLEIQKQLALIPSLFTFCPNNMFTLVTFLHDFSSYLPDNLLSPSHQIILLSLCMCIRGDTSKQSAYGCVDTSMNRNKVRVGVNMVIVYVFKLEMGYIKRS